MHDCDREEQRVVILSAAALGLLLKELVATLGTDSAPVAAALRVCRSSMPRFVASSTIRRAAGSTRAPSVICRVNVPDEPKMERRAHRCSS
jgi:hypothetical protein